jgi:hypothetical protein
MNEPARFTGACPGWSFIMLLAFPLDELRATREGACPAGALSGGIRTVQAPARSPTQAA